MTTLTIGRLARAAGVNIETIRYYQRRGLLATPRKPPGGIRVYPPEILEQLVFIRRAQTLGFTLREIGELLRLGSGRCDDTRQLAESHLTDIERKLKDLSRMRRTLTQLIRACRRGGARHCPIVSTLAAPPEPRSRR